MSNVDVTPDGAIQLKVDPNCPGIRVLMHGLSEGFGIDGVTAYNLSPDEARDFARQLDAAALQWEQEKEAARPKNIMIEGWSGGPSKVDRQITIHQDVEEKLTKLAQQCRCTPSSLIEDALAPLIERLEARHGLRHTTEQEYLQE